ncbi:MAG: ATP-dependent zinc metalloprotease FtsH [Spirochaetaceae bacterium]|jgi:cell division protease FtsH|nr:ATP-dependent zinc metalloprotease FtsH [Spirochaetaceae bacterium]
MPLNQNDNQKPVKPAYSGGKPNPFALFFFLVMAGFFIFYFLRNDTQTVQEAAYSDFLQYLERDEITRVKIFDNNMIEGERRTQGGETIRFKTAIPYMDPELLPELRARNIIITGAMAESLPWRILIQTLPWLIGLGLIFLMFRNMQGTGSRAFQFGKSKAKRYHDDGKKITFADVAGQTDAKYELQEVVSFLKNPQKFTKMGARIPKGVLLVGMPGTGKTLMAKAVAGEAGVNFFHMSGSDFVEMFVGVGASRVRDLFEQGRRSAPCIVFIDELDAVGRTRGAGYGGGHDEREQTLNQLLVEMDGFDGTSGLIILAATNRPDVLDPALLRPGRFDRQVLVDRPDLKGREEILKIHSKGVKLAPAVELEAVARVTSGFSGADLANIVNEAALLAVRAGRRLVEQADFNEAIEKTVAGLQKKTRVLKPEERKLTAYHEAGHALVAAFTPNADPVQKISIIPRGFALGYTLQMPVEDHFTITRTELLGKIGILLGGRIAEEMVSGEYSTGAANDLTKATDIARKMITDYGMSDRFRNVALTSRGAGVAGGERQEPMFQREYAESTQQYVDEEIARVVETQYVKTKEFLEQYRDTLDRVATALLEKETLDEKEFKAIIAQQPIAVC